MSGVGVSETAGLAFGGGQVGRLETQAQGADTNTPLGSGEHRSLDCPEGPAVFAGQGQARPGQARPGESENQTSG